MINLIKYVLIYIVNCRSSHGAAIVSPTFHVLAQTAVGEALLALFLRYVIGKVVVPEFQQLPKLAFRQAVC